MKKPNRECFSERIANICGIHHVGSEMAALDPIVETLSEKISTKISAEISSDGRAHPNSRKPKLRILDSPAINEFFERCFRSAIRN